MNPKKAVRLFEQRLIDPTGLILPYVQLVHSFDEAASLLKFTVATGQVLKDTSHSMTFGINELAAFLSFYLEALHGVDIVQRYRFHGCTPGEFGMLFMKETHKVPFDSAWKARLQSVGLIVMDYSTYIDTHGVKPSLNRETMMNLGDDFS